MKFKEYPEHTDIELTTRCNRNCVFCPYHSKDAPFKPEFIDMDFKVYKKIINEITGKVDSVKLNYRGEPLLYPKLVDAIEYAKKARLRVMINTNGELLNSDVSIKLLKSELDLLILSDYGLEKQFYNGLVYDLLRYYINSDLKIKIKTKDPSKWPLYPTEKMSPIFYNYSNVIEDLRESDFKCTIPFERMLVMANGDLSICSCGTILESKIVGNINDMTIKEVWNSNEMIDLKLKMSNGESHLVDICKACPVRINYIIETKGPLVDGILYNQIRGDNNNK
jgi:MoaA/NifB/PqqE/SkfB family radical SAM enzyme